jgi:hypothetical protein
MIVSQNLIFIGTGITSVLASASAPPRGTPATA